MSLQHRSCSPSTVASGFKPSRVHEGVEGFSTVAFNFTVGVEAFTRGIQASALTAGIEEFTKGRFRTSGFSVHAGVEANR